MEKLQKKTRKYLKSVSKKLNLPPQWKERVINDLVSSIACRKEAGKTDEQIFEELGTPGQVAAELNEQMKEHTYIKSPWRWACLGLIVVCVLCLLFGGFVGLCLSFLNAAVTTDVGVIGGADGPTAIFITSSPDAMLYQTGFLLLLLLMGTLGFYRLSHCPRE